MSLAADPAPWPGVADGLPPDTVDHLAPQPVTVANPDTVLSALREEIASGKKDPDAILCAIASAAQSVTDASGAALGMRRDGVVVCVGRSGETAPALGARLSSESGISGECLRTGRALRCDDTETDPRVDAEVCRHLGLRSIAAVPIRSRLETVGILEVFSTLEGAFSEGDLSWLGNFAELADATPSHSMLTSEIAAVPATPWPTPALAVQSERRWNRSRILIAAGAVVVFVLLGFAGSRIWGGNPAAAPIAKAARPSVQDTPASVPLSSEAPQKLVEQIASPDRERKRAPVGVVQASQSENDDVVVRRLVSPGNAPKPAVGESTPAPEVAIVAEAVTPDLGTSAPTLPTLQHAVSQGVTPLVLQQRVTPRYPQEAKVTGVEGTVVLQAQVTETGRIRRLKTVTGHPMLARAAMDAVRQWRYRPATLNGKPISMETKIAVTFKLP